MARSGIPHSPQAPRSPVTDGPFRPSHKVTRPQTASVRHTDYVRDDRRAHWAVRHMESTALADDSQFPVDSPVAGYTDSAYDGGMNTHQLELPLDHFLDTGSQTRCIGRCWTATRRMTESSSWPLKRRAFFAGPPVRRGNRDNEMCIFLLLRPRHSPPAIVPARRCHPMEVSGQVPDWLDPLLQQVEMDPTRLLDGPGHPRLRAGTDPR